MTGFVLLKKEKNKKTALDLEGFRAVIADRGAVS
jgi:hypothetical protein